MEFLRKAVRVGNSSGVILPKKLLGSEVKVIVINKPLNIKKETFKIINNYLPDIQGIYVTKEKPAEVLAISSSIKKVIETDKLKVNIVPLYIIKKDLKKPALREKLKKAKVILNKSLLFDLRKTLNFYLTNRNIKIKE